MAADGLLAAAQAAQQSNGIEVWLALGAAVFGGVGLKVVETFLNRNAVKDSTAKELREELRTEVASLRTEMAGIEEQLDLWKGKYYELREIHIDLTAQLSVLRMELRTCQGEHHVHN